MSQKQILVLGIGCTLLSDEGFGVKVVDEMDRRYTFPENVSLLDGGVLGVHLMGFISAADHLIVVDAIRNKGDAGDIYRLCGDQIPDRIRAKNSLHQIDFLEALTLCQALDNVPETVIIGVEPEDISTCSIDLTPATQRKVDEVIGLVLKELETLDVTYTKRSSADVSCDSFPNN